MKCIGAIYWWTWDPKEDKVVYPLDSQFDLVIFEDSQGSISNTPLDASSGGQTFNGDMLNMNGAFPEHTEVFLMTRGNGRISVGFRDV